jgi:hypothetical protein
MNARGHTQHHPPVSPSSFIKINNAVRSEDLGQLADQAFTVRYRQYVPRPDYSSCELVKVKAAFRSDSRVGCSRIPLLVMADRLCVLPHAFLLRFPGARIASKFDCRAILINFTSLTKASPRLSPVTPN